MAQLGVGLIGVGRHGVRYARHIVADFPHIRLVGLARRDLDAARAQAGQFGCRAFDDYHELLAAPGIDAVIVVVPPTVHAEIVDAAAAARKAVLLEKPAATTVAAGMQMLRTVRAAGIPVMVAQTLRYNSVVRCLMAARAELGQIHGLRIGQRFEPSRPGWIDDPAVAGAGMLLHTGVHCFDLVRILSGREAERVSAEVGCTATRRTDDNFSVVIRLRDGAALATVGGSRATASRSGGIEVAGERGQLIGDHTLNTACLVRGSTAIPLPVPAPAPTVREVLAAFFGALHDGRPMPIPLEEGLRAVALADASYRAAASGHAVPVEPID